MNLKKLTVLFLLLTATTMTISCEPDKMLNDVNIVSDSGNENNQEKPREPED